MKFEMLKQTTYYLPDKNILNELKSSCIREEGVVEGGRNGKGGKNITFT